PNSPRVRSGGLCATAGLPVRPVSLVLGPWLLVPAGQMALFPMVDAPLRVAFLHQPRYMHVPLPPLLPIVPDDLATNVVWGPPAYLLYVKLLLYLPVVAVGLGWAVAAADWGRANGHPLASAALGVP